MTYDDFRGITISAVLFEIVEHCLMNGSQTFFHEWRYWLSYGVPQPRDDNSSSEDEDSQTHVSSATTSGASESARAAAAPTSDNCCKAESKIGAGFRPRASSALHVGSPEGNRTVCRQTISLSVESCTGQLAGQSTCRKV